MEEDGMSFFEYNNSRNRSPLVSMIANNDVKAVDRLLQGGIKNVHVSHITDKYSNTFLHLSIIFDKYDIFNYLIRIEGLKIDALNGYSLTSLHLAVMNKNEYFVRELIKNGADLNLTGASAPAPLHSAITRGNLDICEILIQNGADIDISDSSGRTPLFYACSYGSIASVYLLLSYNACTRISNIDGLLPLTIAMRHCYNFEGIPNSHLDCHELLFNYTFEEDEKAVVHLSLLTEALKINSPLLPRILGTACEFKYTRYDLRELQRAIIFIKKDIFNMFTKKFSYLMPRLIENPRNLYYRFNCTIKGDDTVIKFMDFLEMLFEYNSSFNFAKGSMDFTYFIETLVYHVVTKHITFDIFERTVYFLYSYGLSCELSHIIIIYENFGFCNILKFMLDLDIVMTRQHPDAIMPYLICDINFTLEKVVDLRCLPSRKDLSALKFFANQKLRNFLAPILHEILDETPQIPSLIELARNAARKSIIDLYKINKIRDFYRIVSKMPINNVYKTILTYEKEIYSN